MNITTQDGLLTDLRWWAQLRVDGDTIVLSDARVAKNPGEESDDSDEIAEVASLVVVDLPDDQEAVQAIFKDINEGIRYGKDTFSVSTWLEERSA